jgi:hypothetical protein
MHRNRLLYSLLCLALVRIGIAGAQNGVAFWEFDPARVDAALQISPKSDANRYESLRKAFVQFQCTPELMVEQPVGRRDEKNLICTLPGAGMNRILVVARFDSGLGHARPTWSDAMLLPLLYHGLQAQPRQHTFLFAAIDGREGEKVFSRWLRNSSRPQPTAAIVLDGLGMSDPRLYIDPTKRSNPNWNDTETDRLLKNEALRTRQLMGIPPQPLIRNDLRPDEFEFLGQWLRDVFASTLVQELKSTPSVAVIYSEVGKPVNPPAFHQDLDFLGWFLCGIDIQLGSPAPPPAS